MKKLLLSALLVSAIAFTSCREEEAKENLENTGEAIENAADDTEEAVKDGFEATGKAIDDAVDETKDAGQSIKNAVNEVSDDLKKD